MKQRQMGFRFWFPASMVVGAMLLSGSLAAQTKTEKEAKPRLLRIIPAAVYATEDFIYPLYEITVVGENLPTGEMLKIYLNDREARTEFVDADTERPPRSSPTRDAGEDKVKEAPEVYRQSATDESQIKLWINKNYHSGLVYLRIGAIASPTPAATVTPAATSNPAAASPAPSPPATSSPSVTTTAVSGANDQAAATATPQKILRSNELPVTLAMWDAGCHRGLFRTATFLAALLILCLPILMVRNLVRQQEASDKTRTPAGGVSIKQGIVTLFFLDKETATYSLSKFQFYVWTAVSVFGYFYLTASSYIVQGVWRFIDIPDNLPSIVFISATTGALAQFVTAQRGPKGAGEEHPSVADFVSSGGIVSAERVQFFIWTIIGALVFVWLVIQQDPASISSLPTVPDGFLQLMGISSFGYLSGKFARRPGPVLNDIVVKVATASAPVTILTLRGRILSPDADFRITYRTPNEDGTELENEVSLTGTLAPKNITVLEADEQSSKLEKTAKKLQLTVEKEDLLRRASKLTISNPDGQSASWPFTGGPEIESIQASRTTNALDLVLTGRNIEPQWTLWIDGKKGFKIADVPPSSPAIPQKIPLKFSGPAADLKAGSHSLEIVNPNSQSAERRFTIEEKPANQPNRRQQPRVPLL